MKCRSARISSKLYAYKERIEGGVFKIEKVVSSPRARRPSLSKAYFRVDEIPALLRRSPEEIARMITIGSLHRITTPAGVALVPAAQLLRYLPRQEYPNA